MNVFIDGMSSKIHDSLKKGIEKFARVSHKELTKANFHSFYFSVKIKDSAVCLYLYYDLDPEDSDLILSWHIHLQEVLNKTLKKVDLKEFDYVVFIMESEDLWDDV